MARTIVPDSMETLLAAYVAGRRSREATRTLLGAALAKGQRFGTELQGLSSAQESDVAALLSEASTEILGVRHPAPSRSRPLGHKVIAALLALSLTDPLSQAVVQLLHLGGSAGVTGTALSQFFGTATPIIAAIAAWMVWTERPNASRAFAVWAGLAFTGAIYMAVVIAPSAAITADPAEALPATPLFLELAWRILLFGWGYWYLARHRREVAGNQDRPGGVI